MKDTLLQSIIDCSANGSISSVVFAYELLVLKPMTINNDLKHIKDCLEEFADQCELLQSSLVP